MVYEWHVLLVFWGLPLSGAVIAAAWVYWTSATKPAKSSYERLLEEKDRLHECVAHWKYPDGTFVPQHKRQRMFRDLHKLSHQIRNHPDHPGKQATGVP